MAIPETCCCSYGFPVFFAAADWYLSQGRPMGEVQRLEKLGQLNGVFRNASLFEDAPRIQAMATLSGTHYFFAYLSPQSIKKYDFDGNLIWTYAADAGVTNSVPGGVANGSHRIHVDAEGNVYLVAVTGSAGSRKMVVNKINSDGTELWSKEVERHSGSGDYWGLSVAVDRDGNVAAVGSAGVTYFDSDGNQQWSATQHGYKICFDSGGNVYILSNTDPPSVWSYDSAGNDRFSLSLPGTNQVRFADIEIFDSRLYYGTYNSLTKKFIFCRRSGESLGTEDWSVEVPYTDTGVGSIFLPRIAVDGEGNLYAAFTTVTSPNRFGRFTRRSASDGGEQYLEARGFDCITPLVPPGRPPLFM